MSNKEEYFSIELKVTNRDDPLVQIFLQQFSAAMVRESSAIQGIPEVQVIACGWDPVCGAMTKCDAFEAYIETNNDDPAEVLAEFLTGDANDYDLAN